MLSQAPAERASALAPPDEIRPPVPPDEGEGQVSPRTSWSVRWSPDPVARPEDVNWRDPRIKTHIYNLLDNPSGVFAFLDARARATLKQCLHHRNPHTGDCYPSCGRLAYELPFRQRSIRYAFGRLCTGPSRQRDGVVVDGHGLMWRAKRWRPYGGQTSNAYGVTCKFLQMAGLVLPHEPESCAECRGEGQGPRVAPARPRRGRAPRPVASSLVLPLPNMQPPAAQPAQTAPTPTSDPHYETFVAAFAAERFAHYGTHDGGTVRAEKHDVIGSCVLELTAEACAWGEVRGLELERGAVCEDLCRRIARIWFEWKGTKNFLVTRPDPHPIGLIVGDLPRLGPEALASWKRSQPKPKAAPLLPPSDEGEPQALGLVVGALAEAAETWPELEASEPTAEEVEVIAAELETPGLVPTGDATFDRAAEQTRASSPITFDQWFGGIQFDSFADGVLTLRARDDFTLGWVQQHFLPTLTNKLGEQTGSRIEVTWSVAPDLPSPLVREPPIAASPRRGQVRTRLALRERPVGTGTAPAEERAAETADSRLPRRHRSRPRDGDP